MKLSEKLKREAKSFRLLLDALPGGVLVLFVLSVFSMNLLANKSIAISSEYLALDCGILVSWVAFLVMDVVTKHFGPGAATKLSVFGVLVSLLFFAVFYGASLVPGTWGEAGELADANRALDRTFGGAWYVILGSTVALTAAAFINNFSNHAVGKLFRKAPDSAAAFVCRAYVSTALGQLADNLIFSLTVSRIFFGWSFVQCVLCALTGMAAELICEALFSVIGFKVVGRWKRQNVGEAYFKFIGESR